MKQPTGRRTMTTTATIDSTLPPDLADAVEAAERLLATRDSALAVLRKSHSRIPELLRDRLHLEAQIGEIEMAGQDASSMRKRLGEIKAELAAQSRMRSACIVQMLGQEDVLGSARARVEAARVGYGQQAIAELRSRYDPKVEELQALWREGDALATALGIKVELPLPVRLVGGVDEGVHPWPGNVSPAALERIEGTPRPIEIDPAVERLAAVRDGLSKGLSHCAGIRAAQQIERRPALQTQRAFNASGTFRVQREFIDHLSGLPYKVGALVDGSLLGPNVLARAFQSKIIVAVAAGADAAA